MRRLVIWRSIPFLQIRFLIKSIIKYVKIVFVSSYLGEVFGSSDEFNRRVLAEFIENLSFEEQDIVNSLRRFLTYF